MFNETLMNASLRLFNSLISEKSQALTADKMKKLYKRTIPHGFILEPGCPSDSDTLDIIESALGLSDREANASFHKSWQIVKDGDLEVLYAQQFFHYVTTYGFKALAVFSDKTVYVPQENLEIPEITDKIRLTVIKHMTKTEAMKRVEDLCQGAALSDQTVKDVFTVIKELKLGKGIIKGIKNREVLALLYDHFDMAPSDPDEFLRYMVYKLTGNTLVIKNDGMIEALESASAVLVDKLIVKAPSDLAKNFYRFKPLYLAMRRAASNKTPFNLLRKTAVRMHVPMKTAYLDKVTALIKSGEYTRKNLKEALKTASTLKKVKLYQALAYRLTDSESIVYAVRNGRGWAKDFDFSQEHKTKLKKAESLVFESIVHDLESRVKGKIFLIPKGVDYALPATEKQFVGNMPSGSSVKVDKDMMVGINWKNVKYQSIDLDLAAISASGKIGWDTSMRTESRDVLFSGDMTDASGPDGATELFYFKGQVESEPRLITVNYYNFNSDLPVPMTIFLAKKNISRLSMNYMVNPNNIVAKGLETISNRQMVMGLVEGGNKFTFLKMAFGKSISSGMTDDVAHMRAYAVARAKIKISLAKVLKKAGAIVITKHSDERVYVDLSPEYLTKDSILNLLQ